MKKSKENFRYKYLKSFDIENIKKLVKSISKEEWLFDQSRQNEYPAHKKTNTFMLADLDNISNWEIGSLYKPNIINNNSELWKSILPIINFLENTHNGKHGRIILPKLFANCEIPNHVDGGDYLDVVRRNHIPIITNSNVFFCFDEEKINMKEGEIWEINNMKNHSVINNSDFDRIHLIIDIIPKQYIAL